MKPPVTFILILAAAAVILEPRAAASTRSYRATGFADPASPSPTASAEPPAKAGTPAPAPLPSGGEVKWDQMRPYFMPMMFVTRVDQDRWRFVIEGEMTPPGRFDPVLSGVARKALEAANDDVAWLIGEVTFRRLIFPGRTFRSGDVAPIPDAYLNALFDLPAFADPLRRFTDAAFRAAGLRCADCLTSLSPAKDVLWSEIRMYVERFIYVKTVTDSGKVELLVGQGENRLPELAYTNQPLAGAVYAALQSTIREAPEFQRAVDRDLNAALLELGDGTPAEIKASLNQKLPPRILSEGSVLKAVVPRILEALERHSLRCKDCRTALPVP